MQLDPNNKCLMPPECKRMNMVRLHMVDRRTENSSEWVSPVALMCQIIANNNNKGGAKCHHQQWHKAQAQDAIEDYEHCKLAHEWSIMH